MLNKLGKVLMHVTMLAIVSAIAAYWVIKILTPQPTAAPPPLAAPLPRDPNPVLAARMFGLIQAPQAATVSNIQVSGVFAAGRDSSAVLSVDGKPARTYVLGQEVVPGNRLVDVQQDVVVLESAGGRQQLRLPPRTTVASVGSAAPPSRAYTLQGNILSAPSSTSPPSMPANRPPVPAPKPNVAPPNPGTPIQPPPSQGAPVGVPPPHDANAPAPPPIQQEVPRQ